jgi:hypothetical protein
VSETVLVVGSVVVVLGLVAVLSIYLYVIGSVVQHIAETLEKKIAAGAQEVGEHSAAIAPAANGLRRRLGTLRSLRRSAHDAPTVRQ